MGTYRFEYFSRTVRQNNRWFGSAFGCSGKHYYWFYTGI
jgi:hypothetical protein